MQISLHFVTGVIISPPPLFVTLLWISVCMWPLFSVPVCVSVILTACVRSLLACILCCDCMDPLHPPELDSSLPAYSSAARPSLTPLQGSEERPRSTLPLPGHSLAPLGHGNMAVESPGGMEVMGDRGSIAGLSCSTLTPSERMDMRQLLRTPMRQQRGLSSICPRLLAHFRRRNLDAWEKRNLLYVNVSCYIIICTVLKQKCQCHNAKTNPAFFFSMG